MLLGKQSSTIFVWFLVDGWIRGQMDESMVWYHYRAATGRRWEQLNWLGLWETLWDEGREPSLEQWMDFSQLTVQIKVFHSKGSKMEV